MATDTRTKSLRYRHVHFLKDGGNLQELLAAAPAKFSMVGQRQETLGSAGEYRVNMRYCIFIQS